MRPKRAEAQVQERLVQLAARGRGSAPRSGSTARAAAGTRRVLRVCMRVWDGIDPGGTTVQLGSVGPMITPPPPLALEEGCSWSHPGASPPALAPWGKSHPCPLPSTAWAGAFIRASLAWRLPRGRAFSLRTRSRCFSRRPSGLSWLQVPAGMGARRLEVAARRGSRRLPAEAQLSHAPSQPEDKALRRSPEEE